MTNFNFEYKGTFLRYKDSNGNLLDLNGSQVDTDLDERTEQNETDIAALQHCFDSISVKEDASGGVASFADGAEGIPVKSLVVNIEPIQEGTGDPSPENVRPISGRTAVNIWRDAEHDTSGEPVLTIQLGQTVYGGTLNVTTGVLTVDRATVDLGTLNWTRLVQNNEQIFVSNIADAVNAANSSAAADAYCSILKVINAIRILSTDDAIIAIQLYVSGTANINAKLNSVSTAKEFKTVVSGQQLVYKLVEPFTVQLSPQTISTILGQNNIWADSGNVAVTYVADTKLYIDSAIAASAESASAESVNANNREEIKETVNEIEKPDVIEEKEVKEDDNIEEREI